MNISDFILAAVMTSEDLLAKRGPSDWGTFMVIVASCFVGLVAVLGTLLYYTRRQRRRPHHHHHHRSHHKESGSASAADSDQSAEPQSSQGEEKRRRRRRRHRRRDHRPRNPTLAETGGLPPIRTEPPPGA